jgi:ribosomal protein S18 acetylase RimI-like enzyme
VGREVMKGLTLRAATAEDRAFLYDLHRVSLKDYITRTWGWDEAWQHRHLDEYFDPKRRQIIQLEGRDIGAIGVSEREADILIDYIAVCPEFQRQGIGSDLIKTIIHRGVMARKPVRLRVLRTNPAVLLYHRLGFLVEEESDTHIQMICRQEIAHD